MDKGSHTIKNADKNPFEVFYDHAIQRMNDGICVNDYVEITKTDIDGLTTEFKDMLKKMKESDLNLRVCKTEKCGNDDMFVEVGEEMGMGLYKRVVVVPSKYLKVISKGRPNGLPDSWYGNKGEDKGYVKVKDTIL